MTRPSLTPPVENYQAVPAMVDGEDDALRRMLAEDPGSDQPRTSRPQFLYRGQPRRYERPYPPEDRGGLAPGSWLLESLIPSDYRGLEQAIREGRRNTPGGLAPYENEQAWVGSLMTAFCLDRHADATGDPASRQWIDSQSLGTVGQRFDRIGSVGQHYGLKTGYLDATSNPMVALWFATHDFQTYQPLGDGPAVVYRIDFGLLERAFAEVNAEQKWTGEDACRASDIRATPQALAPRAAAQQGWSLIHFESPSLQIRLAQLKALHRFEFPRGTATDWRGRLAPHGFRPQPDPMVGVFEGLRSGRIPLQEAQEYVDRHFNPQLPVSQRVVLTSELLASRFV